MQSYGAARGRGGFCVDHVSEQELIMMHAVQKAEIRSQFGFCQEVRSEEIVTGHLKEVSLATGKDRQTL